MEKMRTILDQENWSEIDVPDEFQAIVTSLFFSESETRELGDEVSADIAPSSPKMVRSTDSFPTTEDRLQKISQNAEHTDSTPGSESTTQSNETNSRERGRSSTRLLFFRGFGYHMVNWFDNPLIFIDYCDIMKKTFGFRLPKFTRQL